MSATFDMDTLQLAACQIRVPDVHEKIFKDECSFFYETVEHPNGIYICMKNFIAVGPKMIKSYAEAANSNVFLNHRITKHLKEQTSPQQQPTKLAIGVPGGFALPQDQWDVSENWALVVFPCGQRMELNLPSQGNSDAILSHLKSVGFPDVLARAVSTVISSDSAVLAEERARHVAAWEDENVRPVSVHAANLLQLNNGVRIPSTGWKCSNCDLRENLWLNLTDGSINCGRRFWDGSGGNNHSVEHYNSTKYPLVVKLGTITPEGAEVFSHAEDDMVTDPYLAEHLAHFGIDIMRMEKTDKTIAELEIAANERLGEWRLLQESDSTLEPRYGPGMTGLRNLGNTCYMNSVLQILFAIPDFRRSYAYCLSRLIDSALSELRSNPPGASLPVHNVGLQFAKLGYGLCSGAYSWPYPENIAKLPAESLPPLPGIRPLLFRYLMGQRSRTFASNHQQDACEFLLFLLDLLNSDETARPTRLGNAESQSPTTCFRLSIEDRLECGMTNKVRYSVRDEHVLTLPIPMESMVNRAEFEAYEKRQSEAKTGNASGTSEEVVRARIPFEACLSAWCATERVEDFTTPASDPPGARTFALRRSRLVNFPNYLCVQLAKYTVGSDWLPRKLDCEIEFNSSGDDSNIRINLSHMRSKGGLRPDEQPMPDSSSNTNTQPARTEPDPAIMSELLNMGFTRVACDKACVATNNMGLEAAAGWIMEHLDDPSLNEAPATGPATPSSRPDPSTDSVEMLVAMGLTAKQATNALKKHNNNLEAAANWVFTDPDALASLDQLEVVETPRTPTAGQGAASQATPTGTKLTDGEPLYELVGFISHMGKSTSHGHYVVHIKRSELAQGIPGEPVTPIVPLPDCPPPCGGSPDEWIIFNDEKVAKSESPPFRLAYLYLFRRLDSPRSG